MQEDYQLGCRLYWPARACLESTTIEIPSDPFYKRQAQINLDYDNVVNIGELNCVSTSWTKVDILYFFPFSGDRDAFLAWGRTKNGVEKVIDDAQRFQNLFVDHLKNAHPYNIDIENIRHFGPSDWPYVTATQAGDVLFEKANPSIRHDIASTPLVFDDEYLRSGEEISTTKRLLLRSYDLVKFGYPTEAVLTAVAVLDATLQDSIKCGMIRLGLDDQSVDMLLRNTTQARFATYLDPILKLVCGYSLKEVDEPLFNRLNVVNRLRNNSIHNGVEIKRSEAEKAVCDIFDVLEFLQRYLVPKMDLPPRPELKY